MRQINTVVINELDKVAPLKTVKRILRQLPCDAFLSTEARVAKRQRRRLERLWIRTGSEDVRRQYRDACRVANKAINDSRSNFLASKVQSATGSSSKKWKHYKDLLHCNTVNASHGLGGNVGLFCDKLSSFFHDKITTLHTNNSRLLTNTTFHPLSHDLPYTGIPLGSFTPVTPSEVRRLLSSVTIKFSPHDFFPSSLIKSCPCSFSVIISNLANLSFSQGLFPTDYKTAQITPILKKPNLNPDDPANYRPISNLHTLSKILERLALTRLQPFIASSLNFNPLQSAYRRQHSTETFLVKTLSDIYKAIDSGSSTLLVALDLSAAFNTVPHDNLLQRLHHSFGITDTVLNWVKSYLSSGLNMFLYLVTTLQLYFFYLVSHKVRFLVPCSSLLTRHPSLGLLLLLVSFNSNMQMTHRFTSLSTKLTTLPL